MAATMNLGREAAVPKATVMTSVRVDPALYEQLQKAVQRRGLSINAWLNEAIGEKVEREQKQADRAEKA